MNEYANQKGQTLVPEIEIIATNNNKKDTPDGSLKGILRQDWGYWESKDRSDDLDEEIKKKFDKGYPKENILFHYCPAKIYGFGIKKGNSEEPPQ